MKKVTIVDYGLGNMLSVSRALEYSGGVVAVSSNPAEIAAAERLVLPGVGAFHHGMQELIKRDLQRSIIQFVKTERPFLGICLGMQMMLSSSEEFEGGRGLNLIAGAVKKIPEQTTAGSMQKIPHIGWNSLLPANSGLEWKKTVLKHTVPRSAAYFVHSYTAHPANPQHRIADCDYGGHKVAAVIGEKNMFGCQFHPEKSGDVGLGIVKAFFEL